MVIPTSLIPSDEKREIDKKKLIFALLTGSFLIVPLLLGLYSGLSQVLKAGLEPEKIYVVGLLSSYKCHTERYGLSKQEGRNTLISLMDKNSLNHTMLSDPSLNKVAEIYAKKLRNKCESAEISEERTINNIYRSLGSKKID